MQKSTLISCFMGLHATALKNLAYRTTKHTFYTIHNQKKTTLERSILYPQQVLNSSTVKGILIDVKTREEK